MTAMYPPRFVEFLEELRDLGPGDGPARRREIAALFGVSLSTLSRWCRAAGLRVRERSDLGERRVQVKEETLQELFRLQQTGRTLKHGVQMPAKDVIDIAERNGLIPAGAVTPNYFNAWLRAQGFSRAEVDTPEPHVDLVSLGPQHVHQADFSLSINWKVEKHQIVYEHWVYKNKLPPAGVPRIWRFMLVDHATGYFFPHYAISPGESLKLFLEGIYRGWSVKELGGQPIQGQYPFRGVPRILMVDKGPGMKAGITGDLMERLGVTLNICKGSRSKGQVESLMWWWEQRFESRFRLQPLESIERLNEEAVEFAAWLCSKEVHSRTGATRRAKWEFHLNRSFETQLRMLNIDFETFTRIAMSEPQRCRVSGSGVVMFRSQKYRVPAQLIEARYVAVQYSPFEFPKVTVRAWEQADAPGFLCEPIELDEFGFPRDGVVIGQEYRSHEHTERRRMVAGAETWLKDYQRGTGERLQTRGYHLERVEASGIKSAEQEIETAAPAAPGISKVRAREEVLAAIARPFTKAEAEYLNSVFGAVVTGAEIDAAIEQIEQGLAARVLSFPKAGGSL